MGNKQIYELQELFEAVQSQHIFADQKTFVDAVPMFAAEDILSKYHEQKNGGQFCLKSFVENNFYIEKTETENPKQDNAETDITDYINNLWDELVRTNSAANGGTIIPLPYPFVAPGGRFNEIYYWDSYFTMLGLQISGRHELVENMIKNFTYLINKIGFIPNGNRTYFLSRSQPPFYAYMVELLAKEKGEKILAEYIQPMLKEYAFWMLGEQELSDKNNAAKHAVRMPDGSVLNRYFDTENTPRPEGYSADLKIGKNAKDNPELFRNIRAACESGWDFSSRWFADGKNIETICTLDIIPVDLNCLLWHLESVLAKAYSFAGNKAQEHFFINKASARKNAIEKFLWNAEKNIYQDYNHVLKQTTDSVHLGMAFPLFTGIAGDERAKYVLQFIEKNLLSEGGLKTTAVRSGQQWDEPNGWAPLQWIVYVAAKQYGANDFANKIKEKWCATVEKGFDKTGKLWEKYNVESNSGGHLGGEYQNQEGFGWTNGVYLAMKNN